MAKTPIDIAKGVIDLFADGTKWSQGAYALTAPDAEGEPYQCSSHDDDAVCFCIMGAVDKVAGGSFFQADEREKYPTEKIVADALMAELGSAVVCDDPQYAPYEPIAAWNDRNGRTIDEVRDLMQRTLRRLEAEASA